MGLGGWERGWRQHKGMLLNYNSCSKKLASNFPFFSSGSTWASLDIAASLFGTPSPSISSTIITVSHFPKLLPGKMSDLMLSPKYTTWRLKQKGDRLSSSTWNHLTDLWPDNVQNTLFFQVYILNVKFSIGSHKLQLLHISLQKIKMSHVVFLIPLLVNDTQVLTMFNLGGVNI